MNRNTAMQRVGLLILTALLAIPLSADDCSDKTGFARKACEAQAAQTATAVAGAGDTAIAAAQGQPLSTSLSDAIHLDTLPPSIEPLEFAPLLKLDRTAEGAFILQSGIYEAYLQSYTLAFNDAGQPRPDGFFPAPIKGSRASVIAAILKYAELHPEVAQPAIQLLLSYTVNGTDLDKMPKPVQQAAERLLPKETLLKLRAGGKAKSVEDKLLKILGRKIGSDPTITKEVGGAVAKEKQIDQQVGISGAVADLKTSSKPFAAGSTARGTWAQMPGGFYVRYLPDAAARTRLQVIVPETAMEGVKPDKPLTFDPMQYVAVHAGAPPQTLGLTLRPVGGR
jgi:hypothetical protein